jgi:outer membrane immunogenic protein
MLLSNHYDFNWTSHIRGRVGYATSNVLWFIAGGLALADFDYTQGSSGITVSGSTFTGWTLGVGADIAITRSWIARVEYLHDDFGDKNFLIDNDPYRVKLTGDTVRGALMYKF